jgi:Mrp family chromosome partitioning ATPase
MLVVLRNSINETILTASDSEEALGIASAGVLPKITNCTANGIHNLILKQPNSAYRRALSSIFVPLAPLFASAKGGKLVIVTSADEDDGKTELAWGLALSAKRFGYRALFINLDAQMTQQGQSFWRDFDTGSDGVNFIDFLGGTCPLQDVVVDVPEAGIQFAKAPADSADLIARLSYSDIQRGFDILRQAYGIVIVNGPNGAADPEMRFLVSHADTILLAVRQGKTNRSLARATLQFFTKDSGHTKSIGSVMTSSV